MQIENRVKQIFIDILNVKIEVEDLKSDNSNWDSLQHLNLILALEEEFDIEITPEDFSKLYSNYKIILKYIKNKVNHKC